MTTKRRRRERESEEEEMSSEERFRLEDLIASYGGEASVMARRNVLPANVVDAVKKLTSYDVVPLNLHNEQMIKDINLHCFNFIQQIIMMGNSTHRVSSFDASLQRQCGKSTLRCTPPTWIESPYAFTSKWISLLKKISLVLKKRDKLIQKQCTCECKTFTPQLYEFSLACTPCDRGIDGVQCVLNNWYVDYGYDDEPPPPPQEEGQWQIYDYCYDTTYGDLLERYLKTRGKLIKMLRDEDEDAVGDRIPLRLMLRLNNDSRQQNYHTFENVQSNIVLRSPVLFCYRGSDRHCECRPSTSAMTFVKRCVESTPPNNLILTQWPFEHNKQDQLVESSSVSDDPPANDQIACTPCIQVRSFTHQSCLVQRVVVYHHVDQSR